jgi:hypothetical protein
MRFSARRRLLCAISLSLHRTLRMNFAGSLTIWSKRPSKHGAVLAHSETTPQTKAQTEPDPLA